MNSIYASHGAIAPFRLVRPSRVAEAAAALAPDAAFYAGGVDLIPALRAGRRIATLIDLSGIAALHAVERRSDSLRIGAAVSYHRLATDPVIAAALPDFARLWRDVANVRVRHAATLGGNIMAGNPAYDALPALIAQGARLIVAARDGALDTVEARMPVPEGRLLVAIDVPVPEERRFAFDRGLKPVIAVAVSIERRAGDWNGRAAFGCAFPRPIGVALDLGGAADPAAIAARADAIAAGTVASLPPVLDDFQAGAAYRRRMATVLLARALRGLAAP